MLLLDTLFVFFLLYGVYRLIKLVILSLFGTINFLIKSLWSGIRCIANFIEKLFGPGAKTENNYMKNCNKRECLIKNGMFLSDRNGFKYFYCDKCIPVCIAKSSDNISKFLYEIELNSWRKISKKE